jgi:hypothetical protein
MIPAIVMSDFKPDKGHRRKPAMPFRASLGQLSCPRATFQSQWTGRSRGSSFTGRSQDTYKSCSVLDLRPDRQRRRTYATAVEDPPRHKSQNPYPYPSQPSPSAHQIFHLKTGATPAQIKSRCKSRRPPASTHF